MSDKDFAKQFFRWRFWEKIFLSFEFLLVLALGAILYADFQNRLDAGSKEEIGIITFKQRTVQRKYSDRAVWESMENSFPLYNKDSIRTGDISDAEITLKDGTTLEIDENSLIVLNIAKDRTEIDFSYGSISANSSGENVDSVRINMGDKSLSLQDSIVNISKTSGSEILVDVKEGFASLLTGSTKTDISSNEKLIIQEDNIEKSEKPFRVVSPSPNYKTIFTGDWVNLEYVLEGYDSSKPGLLEFSRNRNFTNIFYKRTIPSSRFSEPFKSGIYYWRATQNGKISSIGKVNLIQVTPSRLINPSNNSRIFMKNDTSLVSFAWTLEEGVGQYELEIANEPSFSTIFQKKTVLGSSLSIEIPEGTFYWRVRSIVSGGVDPVLSSAQSLILTKEEVVSPPNLLHPKPGDELSQKIVQDTGVGLFWSQLRGYDGYEVEVSRRSDFSDSITLTSKSSNIVYTSDFSIGEYYWRVRGITPSGKKGEYSKFSSFLISNLDKNVFNLQSESTVSEATATKDGITLRWKKLPVNGTYEVLLAKDKDFKQVVKKIITNLNQAKIQELVSGKYYWKVSLLDDSGNPTLVSDYKSLEVRDSLGPIFPKKGERINMTTRDVLSFEWEARSSITNYVIIIYQNTTNGKKTILQKSTSSNRFLLDELDLLDEGRFEWEIYYLEAGERKREFQSDFYIDLDPLPESLELLTPKIQYAD